MLNCQRHLFNLEDSQAYLNGAYMSPQLKSVEEAGLIALQKKSRPYQIGLDDFFGPVARLKATFAKLVNAGAAERIALIPSVSYGISTVARNAPVAAGSRIIMAEEQFPSNYYAWKRLADERGAEVCCIPPPDSSQRAAAWNEALLHAIDSRTAVVALGNVHWGDGTRFDLRAVRARANEVGAWLVVDGTQSVGALPFDVAEIQPDALICAGYKWLMGPYSIGLAYYGPAMDGGIPLEENWINRHNSHDFTHLAQYQPAYQPMAGRYNTGEQSNFILVPMMQAALGQILEWGVPEIQEYGKELFRETGEALAGLGCQLDPEDSRAHHLVGVRLPKGVDMQVFKEALGSAQVHVSIRGNAIRVSCHVYNQKAELERLLRCFRQVLGRA